MLKSKLKLIFSILCVFQLAASLPTKESSTKDTKAALEVRPDVELVDLEGVVKPDEDAWRRAAVSNGMDPAIVAEVIRNRKPVVRTETDASGAKRTTTYKLEPDGSISRHTLTEYAPTTVHRVQGPTFGSRPTTTTDPKVDKDWEWNPTSQPRFGTPTTTHTFNFPEYTPIWTRPVFTNYQPTHRNDGGSTTLNWPQTNTFGHVDPSNSGTVTKTVTNDDGSKVTTTHTVGPTKWTTHTYTYPATSSVPRFNIQTTTPFPSLEDFLKAHDTTTGNTPVTKINIEDLPAVQMPVNGLEHRDNPSTVQTTKTYTKTIQTSGNPTAADLDPKMREILNNAGISADELLNSKNGTITKTRREPDGRLVTTTYRVRTVPSDTDDNDNHAKYAPPTFTSTFDLDEPRGPFFIIPTTTTPRSHIGSSHSGTIFPTVAHVPETPTYNFLPNGWRFGLTPKKPETAPTGGTFSPTKKNAIEEYLSKVDLTPETIDASNGEVIKTIVDDKGRVLTATFVLSTVKNGEVHSQNNDKKDPIK